MNPDLHSVVSHRVDIVTRAITRHRLVLVQLGVAFDPIRDRLLDGVGGVRLSSSTSSEWSTGAEGNGLIIIEDLEVCRGESGIGLAGLRRDVFAMLDSRKAVCLVSRSPRAAFASVLGSSLLEDAALVKIPLMQRSELDLHEDETPSQGWMWPYLVFGGSDEATLHSQMLHEIGQGLVAALAHALFEVHPKQLMGLGFLSSRDVEGLVGCGFLTVTEQGEVRIVEGLRPRDLRDAVASYVSDTLLPEEAFSRVVTGLWFVERKVRRAVRRQAINDYKGQWRQAAVGNLDVTVLGRAQLDSVVSASTVSELRDPFEWLTFGELLDMVRSERYGGLGTEPVIWRKMQEQLLPVRNRLAHVRLLRSGDDETVAMWVKIVQARFGD